MELLRPSSADEAAAALGNGSVALAGGTGGTRIGAGTTLAELEVDPEIPQTLREACSLAA